MGCPSRITDTLPYARKASYDTISKFSLQKSLPRIKLILAIRSWGKTDEGVSETGYVEGYLSCS